MIRPTLIRPTLIRRLSNSLGWGMAVEVYSRAKGQAAFELPDRARDFGAIQFGCQGKTLTE
jgi:hypothetical protein